MKTPYFLIQTLLICGLGLISCSPDKNSGETDTQGQLTVEIQNSDETIQKIQSTKTLRVASQIALIEKKGAMTIQSLKTTTTCTSSQQQGSFSRSTEIESIRQIAVKDILPSQVFAPQSPDPKVFCDIQMEMRMQSGDNVAIDLQQVSIVGSQDFQNHDLSFLTDRERPYYTLQDLASRAMNWPVEKGFVETLCSYSKSETSLENASIQIQNLFPDHLFHKENLQNCRFIVRSENKAWVTGAFFVQKSQPKLNHEIRFVFNGEPEINYNKAVVMTVTLQNSGDSVSYFKLNLKNPGLTITPAYRQGQTGFQIHQTYDLHSKWQIFAGDVVKHDPNPNEQIYRLAPEGILEMELVVSDSLQCSEGQTGNPPGVSTSNCNPHMAILLHGMRYQVANFPMITESAFENFKWGLWMPTRTLQPSATYRSVNGFNFWAPNLGLKKLCAQVKTYEPPASEVFQKMSNRLQSNDFRCR